MKEETSNLIRCLERGDDDEATRSLGRLFKIADFSVIIVEFLVFAFEWPSASVNVNQQKQMMPKIHSYLDRNGMQVLIRLPSGIYALPPPSYSLNYTDPIVKENLDPWLKAIKYLDCVTLTAVFARFVEVMDKEYSAASSIVSHVDLILKKKQGGCLASI